MRVSSSQTQLSRQWMTKTACASNHNDSALSQVHTAVYETKSTRTPVREGSLSVRGPTYITHWAVSPKSLAEI
eukprot:1575125-Prymnesium_polylepis.1